MTTFPRPLVPITGPFRSAKVTGAADGMGTYGDATRELVAGGRLPPDLICGMTLALIAQQPREPRKGRPERASGVAGNVWVRERFTIHRPVALDEAWTVEGEQTGTYVRKGRTHSTTASRSSDSAGRRFATNLTTGLIGYRADPGKPDSVEGLPLEDTPSPGPDFEAAAANPCLDALGSLTLGQRLGDVEVPMTLAMMAARDTDNPDNPIHSDLEEAKKAGLARPIAGGSHVLSFALEAVMGSCGVESLLHGANFDVRWKAPTEDDTTIVPSAVVDAVEADRVEFALQVDLVDGPTVMVGRLIIPLPQ